MAKTYTGQTGTDGKVELNVPTGTYDLEIKTNDSDLRDYTETGISIAGDYSETDTVLYDTITQEVIIVDTYTGSPINGATATVVTGTGGELGTFTTNVEGKFTVNTVHNKDTIDITVTSPKEIPVAQYTAEYNTPITIQCPDQFNQEVNIVDEDTETPLTGFKCNVSVNSGTGVDLTTDSNGKIYFSVFPDDEITIITYGKETKTDTFTAKYNTPITIKTLANTYNVRVEYIGYDEATGYEFAISNAIVTLISTDGTEYTGTTNESGVVNIQVNQGTYKLHIELADTTGFAPYDKEGISITSDNELFPTTNEFYQTVKYVLKGTTDPAPFYPLKVVKGTESNEYTSDKKGLIVFTANNEDIYKLIFTGMMEETLYEGTLKYNTPLQYEVI